MRIGWSGERDKGEGRERDGEVEGGEGSEGKEGRRPYRIHF